MQRQSDALKGVVRLGPPFDWASDFPRIQWSRHRVEVFASSPARAYDDVSIAGLGFFSVAGGGSSGGGGGGRRLLEVVVPKGVKVFRRPALLPTMIQHGDRRGSWSNQ